MDDYLDRKYLDWLYEEVASVRLKNPERTYWSLLRQLFTKQFVWLIPNDDNRYEDGRDLRGEFAHKNPMVGLIEPMWWSLPCSMLEFLIGVSRRLSFEAGGEPRAWFWHLIDTLDIRVSDKDYTAEEMAQIDEVLDRVVFRNYAPNGDGGLFPLRNPHEDQRLVEIWAQLNSYLLELS